MCELEKILNLEFIGRAFRNLFAVRDADNFKSHLQTAWLSDSNPLAGAERLSRAYLSRLRRGRAGAGRGPQSRRCERAARAPGVARTMRAGR